MGIEGLLAPAVVERVVGVKPVALAVDVQVRDLGNVRGLDQHLLLGNQGRHQLQLVVVQVKVLAVELAVEVGVGEKNLGAAGFDQDIEDLGFAELIERLGGENQGGVALAPGTEGLGDVGAQCRGSSGTPRLRR